MKTVTLRLTEEEIVILKRGIEAYERAQPGLGDFEESNDLWLRLDDAHVQVLEEVK